MAQGGVGQQKGVSIHFYDALRGIRKSAERSEFWK